MDSVSFHKPGYRLLAVLALATAVAGCSATGGRVSEAQRTEAAGLHASAMEALERGDPEAALDTLKQLHDEHPATPHGRRVLLEMAYTATLIGRHDDAMLWAGVFAEEAADHGDEIEPADVEYALYLRGAAAHARWNESNSLPPDTALARRAFGYYRDLVVRYPEGERAATALRGMNELRGDMAAEELRMARLRLKEGAYPEAAERAAWVAEQYRGGRHAADALRVQIEALEKMGRTREADATRRMLEILFPDL